MIARYGIPSLALWASAAWASPWVITRYVEVSETTAIPATTIGTFYDPALVFTYTIDVTPTVTPAPKPTKIWVETDNYYSDLTNVYIALPTEAVVTANPYEHNQDFEYYIPVTYHAPKTCGNQWTYTTKALAFPPPGVKPGPSASFLSYDSLFSASDYLLEATQFPTSVVASLSTYYQPTWVTGCTIPEYVTATYPTYASYPTYYSGGDGYNDYADCDPFELDFGGSAIGGGYICGDEVDYTYGLSLVGFICVWIFSWLGFFLICGLIESWISFKHLSLGKSARRGIPICFGCLFPLLSCLLLLGSRAGYQARSAEEQKRLQTRWDGLDAHTAVGQWLSWGFRHKYPPFLGQEPPLKGQTIQQVPPQMISAPGGYYVYQPHPQGPPPPGAPGQAENLYPPPYAPAAPKQVPTTTMPTSPPTVQSQAPGYSYTDVADPTSTERSPAAFAAEPTARTPMTPPPPGHHELE